MAGKEWKQNGINEHCQNMNKLEGSEQTATLNEKTIINMNTSCQKKISFHSKMTSSLLLVL